MNAYIEDIINTIGLFLDTSPTFSEKEFETEDTESGMKITIEGRVFQVDVKEFHAQVAASDNHELEV